MARDGHVPLSAQQRTMAVHMRQVDAAAVQLRIHSPLSRVHEVARIMSDAFSPIMMHVALRLALTTKGMIEASAT